MPTKYIKIILLLLVVSFIFFVTPTFAAKTIGDAKNILQQAAGPSGIFTTNLPRGVPEMIGFWIKIALSFVGTIFFILMVYAGFRWMTARGEEDQIKSSRDTITMAVIGLLVVLSGYAITNLLVTRIMKPDEALKNVSNLDKASSVLGCCVEYMDLAGFEDPRPNKELPPNTKPPLRLNKACYITTKANCDFQGLSKKGCAEPGEGCWQFYTGAQYSDDEAGNDQCTLDYCK